MKTTLLWFRHDLRLADHPALNAALKRRGPVVPVFIWAPEEEGDWPPGCASKWWLHQSLTALDLKLQDAGSRLIVCRGPTLKTLRTLAMDCRADAVFWNRRYEPVIIARDKKIGEALRGDGLESQSFNAALLHEPWTIQNKSGRPFQIFTPFWRHCLTRPGPARPEAAPKHIPAPSAWPKSLRLEELRLEPRINWTGGLHATWQPGEAGGRAQLERFLRNAFDDYSTNRNRPDLDGTSRLSPHLHFGEISPRQIWHGLRRRAERRDQSTAEWRGSQFLAEVGWREFSHHLLYHFPHTPTRPLRAEFAKFPWRKNPGGLRAWQKGLTGYPIVDAGMRELWATGWMHNRVRMIAASFLVKDLLASWRNGAAWFWDALVDADLAQNTLG